MNNIFIECFSQITDPHVERHKKHLLMDVIALTLFAIMSGAQNFAWFRKMALSLLAKDGTNMSNRRKMLSNWANPENMLKELGWL